MFKRCDQFLGWSDQARKSRCCHNKGTGVQSSVTNVFQGRLKGFSDADSDACHATNNTRQRVRQI